MLLEVIYVKVSGFKEKRVSCFRYSKQLKLNHRFVEISTFNLRTELENFLDMVKGHVPKAFKIYLVILLF